MDEGYIKFNCNWIPLSIEKASSVLEGTLRKQETFLVDKL